MKYEAKHYIPDLSTGRRVSIQRQVGAFVMSVHPPVFGQLEINYVSREIYRRMACVVHFVTNVGMGDVMHVTYPGCAAVERSLQCTK